MKNIYYTNSPFISSILSELLSSLELNFQLFDDRISYFTTVECSSIPSKCKQLFSMVKEDKTNHFIFLDRYRNDWCISYLPKRRPRDVNIIIFQELQLGADNVEDINMTCDFNPAISQVVFVNNLGDRSSEIDWNSESGIYSLSEVTTAGYPIIEIPKLALNEDVLNDIHSRRFPHRPQSAIVESVNVGSDNGYFRNHTVDSDIH